MKFGYVSWLPETDFMARFVEELEKNKLMGTRCKGCGARYLPPRAHCRCGSVEMEWFEASRKGKILAYTLVTFPPESMSKNSPYIMAVAELEDGLRLLAQLTGVAVKNLKIGMSVRVTSDRTLESRVVYRFEPL